MSNSGYTSIFDQEQIFFGNTQGTGSGTSGTTGTTGTTGTSGTSNTYGTGTSNTYGTGTQSNTYGTTGTGTSNTYGTTGTGTQSNTYGAEGLDGIDIGEGTKFEDTNIGDEDDDDEIVSGKQFMVKTPTGRGIVIDLDPKMTVGDLKNRVARVSNIPSNEQRLIFRGKQLDNNSFTISDYNVEPDSIITMVASLKGGFC